MRYVIGLDIGGTKIKGIIANTQGSVLVEETKKTSAHLGKDYVLSVCFDIIQSLLKQPYEIGGIGVATGGRVNTTTGEIVYATDNLPGWMGLNLKKAIEDQFSLPTYVDNDANLALLGEMWVGSAKHIDNVVMLTLGTGVGGANAFFGNIYQGATYDGGEWGHVVLHPGGHLCNCGKQGCIEQYISGNALRRHAQQVLNRSIDRGSEIFELFSKQDECIKPVVNEFIDNLVLVLKNIHNAINPQAIVIGGGIIDSKEVWMPLLNQKIATSQEKPTILAATLGNTAGAIGACKAVLDLLVGK